MKINDIEEIVRFSYLLDYYGALLNERQFKICDGYVFDNLSLSELAEIHDMSRQGIYDILKRAKNKLEEYEKKLELEKKHALIVELSEKAKEKLKMISCENSEEITSILDEITEVV